MAVVFAGLCTFNGPLISIFLVDRAGRKALLLFSYFIQFGCFTVMGAYFYLQSIDPNSVKVWRLVPVVMLCVYIFTNSMGCSPMCFVVVGEIFAQNIKDVAAGITMTFTYIASIIVTLGFPYLSEIVGTGIAFFIFSAFNAFNFLFIMFALPETKGKTFSEIQLAFLKKK